MFNLIVSGAGWSPNRDTFSRGRQWSAAMAERMNLDLVFDHTEAVRDLGFKPSGFALAAEDLPT